MKKVKWIACLLLCFFAVAFCSSCHEKQEEKEEIKQIETQKKDTEDQVYAIVTKSQDNAYNLKEADGFKEEVEKLGAKCLVMHPRVATAKEQADVIKELMEEGVDGIAVAVNDAEALSPLLKEAMAMGITVTTLDSNAQADATQLFVNQVDARTLANTLLDSVYQLMDGAGQWAIVSASSVATNQSTWIAQMRQLLEENDKYNQMELLEIAYGDDLPALSEDQTAALLQNYPDLKVICAPTTVGCLAAAKVVSTSDTNCKVTGLGLPSEMELYLGDKCPSIFLWNPADLGRLSARATMAIARGEIEVLAGVTLDAGDLGIYTIEQEEGESLEVVLGPMIKITQDNINNWKDVM